MQAPDTLSSEQWTTLQVLFDRAVASEADACRSLVSRISAEDPVLGRSLAAMLAAHEQWSGRTDDVHGDLQRQTRDSALLANGESIGPYRILSLLGEGGMGVVYRAERADGEVTLTAAIKVLRPGALDANGRERFQRERDLLAGLSHPHIARLFDAGVRANGQPYFVMEYVGGTTIERYCDAQRLDVRERLRVFLDVCDAVRHAHNQLVLHRDIKPSNVLVDESGVAKLIDFGIAKPLALNEEHAEATATAQRFFSPLNVAPEQLRGERMGVACDVYQLGTLLYELLCGRPIFDLEGKTFTAIERAIGQQIPLAPSVRAKAADAAVIHARGATDARALARQLGGDLDEITLMALRKEPARRYASVEQLMEDIQRHLDVRPVRARGSGRGYRVTRFVKRYWRALGLGTVAVLAAVAFVATLAFQSRQLQRERDRAIAEEHRAVAEQHHAVAEQHRAEQATQFLVDIFSAADPRGSPDQNTSIRDVLEIGRHKLDTELTGDPQLKADLSYAMAGIYSDIGSMPDALKYANQALDLRETLEPGSMEVARSLGKVAFIDSKTGDCKGATQAAASAQALYRRLGAGVSRTYALQQIVIDCEAHEQGGEHAVRRAYELLDALQHDPAATVGEIVTLDVWLSDYLLALGRTDEGVRVCKSSVDLLDRRGFKKPEDTVDARLCLATALSQAGKFEVAGAQFNGLAADLASDYGRESATYGIFLLGRGGNFADWGQPHAAEADLLEARRILVAWERPPGPLQSEVADALASLYENGYQDLKRAGPFHTEAVRDAMGSEGPHDLDTQTARLHQAQWLGRSGRDREAETALRGLIEELPITNRPGWQARLALAAILARSGRHADAEALFAACEKEMEANKDMASLKSSLEKARKGEL